MRRRLTAIVIVLTVLWLTGVRGRAYEVSSHAKMTELAVLHWFGEIDKALTDAYGLEHGLAEPFSNSFLMGSVKATARSWIMTGSEREDDFSRPLNHFHNPLHTLGISGLGVGFLFRFPSSVLWAQAPAGTQDPAALPSDCAGAVLSFDVTDNMSWRDARRYLKCALIASDAVTREAAFAATFDAVGHVMHLVQDSTAPAHVRNDPHMGLVKALNIAGVPVTSLFGILDPDGLHAWVEKHNDCIQTNGIQANDCIEKWGVVDPDPVLLMQPGIERTLPISNLFDTDTGVAPTSALTAGAAEFANGSFFSDDTTADAALPHPVATDLHGPVVDPTNNQSYLASADVTHAAGCATLFPVNPSPTTCSSLYLDELVWADYAHKLVPRAIGYSAALLKYFVRGGFKASVIGDALELENPGDEDMDGTFTAYYDGIDNLRHPVPGASYQLQMNAHAIGQVTAFAAPTSPAPARPGAYVVLFEGTLGKEDGAVAAAQIKPACELLGVTTLIAGTGNLFGRVNVSSGAVQELARFPSVVSCDTATGCSEIGSYGFTSASAFDALTGRYVQQAVGMTPGTPVPGSVTLLEIPTRSGQNSLPMAVSIQQAFISLQADPATGEVFGVTTLIPGIGNLFGRVNVQTGAVTEMARFPSVTRCDPATGCSEISSYGFTPESAFDSTTGRYIQQAGSNTIGGPSFFTLLEIETRSNPGQNPAPVAVLSQNGFVSLQGDPTTGKVFGLTTLIPGVGNVFGRVDLLTGALIEQLATFPSVTRCDPATGCSEISSYGFTWVSAFDPSTGRYVQQAVSNTPGAAFSFTLLEIETRSNSGQSAGPPVRVSSQNGFISLQAACAAP